MTLILVAGVLKIGGTTLLARMDTARDEALAGGVVLLLGMLLGALA